MNAMDRNWFVWLIFVIVVIHLPFMFTVKAGGVPLAVWGYVISAFALPIGGFIITRKET